MSPMMTAGSIATGFILANLVTDYNRKVGKPAEDFKPAETRIILWKLAAYTIGR